MAKPDELRTTLEETRKKLFRTLALLAVFAAAFGWFSSGFPHTVESVVAFIGLVVSFGVFTRYATKLDRVAREMRRQRKAIL